MYPQKQGKLEINPMTLDVSIDLPTNRRDFFGNVIYNQTSKKVSSKKRIINVSSLPTNKPDDFSGAVGDFEISRSNLEALADSCCEFLIHATDVEGKQQGIDVELVAFLGEITPLPATYAGGVRAQSDIDQIDQLGQGKLDFTVGSALDMFGGDALHYADMVARYRT